MTRILSNYFADGLLFGVGLWHLREIKLGPVYRAT